MIINVNNFTKYKFYKFKNIYIQSHLELTSLATVYVTHLSKMFSVFHVFITMFVCLKRNFRGYPLEYIKFQ